MYILYIMYFLGLVGLTYLRNVRRKKKWIKREMDKRGLATFNTKERKKKRCFQRDQTLHFSQDAR